MVDFNKLRKHKLFKQTLDCSFCDRKFHDFGALGEHVRQEHPEIGAALPSAPEEELIPDSEMADADSSWEEHGWFLGTELDEMIKVNRQAQPQTGTASQRGVQFLGLKHITNKDGHLAKITKVTTDKPDNFGNPYVVYFEMNGVSYSKGFKETSPNLIDLVDCFGENEEKWTGQTVIINKEQDEDDTIRLTFSKAARTAAKK